MKRVYHLSESSTQERFDILFETNDMYVDKVDILAISDFSFFVTKEKTLRDVDFLIVDIKTSENLLFDAESIIDGVQMLSSFSKIKIIFILKKDDFSARLAMKLQEKNIKEIIQYEIFDLEKVGFELDGYLQGREKSFLDMTSVTMNGMQQNMIDSAQIRLHIKQGKKINIGVATTHNGIGASTQSFLIFDYLKRIGLSPLIISLDATFYERLKVCFDERENILGVLSINDKQITTAIPETEKYNAFIIDFGTLTEELVGTFREMDIPILLSTTRNWDVGYLNAALQILGNHFSPLLWFSFADESEFNTLCDWERLESFTKASVPYTPNIWKLDNFKFFNENLLQRLKVICNEE